MQLGELFITILNMSITASYAIAAVVILRLFLKKAPGWVTCALWGVASFRLVFPFSMESVLSVFSLLPSSDTVTPEILYSAAPTIHSGIPAVNSTVNPVISESMAPAVDASVSPIQVAAYIAGIIWIAGITAMLIYSIVAYVKLRRKTRTATLLEGNVYQSENAASPFLLGFIKPKIYIPYSLGEPELAHVVSHENAHIARRDHLLKPLAFFILMLHWFNPLIWVAYILLSRDIETACDEKVIKTMSPAERKSYSQALLALTMPVRRIAACPLAFGEVSVKDRVKKTLSYKKPAFWIIIVALVACAVVAVCLLTDPIKEAEPDGTGAPEAADAVSEGDAVITAVSEIYGTYHPTEVIYVDPVSSFYPNDLDQTPYYTFAENEFKIVTPGQSEPQIYAPPKYDLSMMSQSEFYDMFILDVDIPDISDFDSIQRVTVTSEYSLFIVGSSLWFVDTHGGENIWLIYKLESSEPYSGEQIAEYPANKRLTPQALASIIREKGSSLSWDDFARFEHEDIGSGLYIWQIPIDANYCVLIGGPDSHTPMYVRLVKLSSNGERTDEEIDLLDENVDVQSFFEDTFGIQIQPLVWMFNPLISSVFPALPVNISLRFSTVDVMVDSGSLYLHGNGKTQYLGDSYTYQFGETIYWSPLPKETYETSEALYADIAASCTLQFAIKNNQDDAMSSGSIYIAQTDQTGNDLGEYEYAVLMADSGSPALKLEYDSERLSGFVMTIN